jgi:hypothetical protein
MLVGLWESLLGRALDIEAEYPQRCDLVELVLKRQDLQVRVFYH